MRISGNRSRRWQPWPPWPWRRQQQPPAWPTDQVDRPTWAVEQQQQILPAVEPTYRECKDMQ